MNVRELIAALSELDGDLPVTAEGCDCANPVDRVSVEKVAGEQRAWLSVDLT